MLHASPAKLLADPATRTPGSWPTYQLNTTLRSAARGAGSQAWAGRALSTGAFRAGSMLLSRRARAESRVIWPSRCFIATCSVCTSLRPAVACLQRVRGSHAVQPSAAGGQRGHAGACRLPAQPVLDGLVRRRGGCAGWRPCTPSLGTATAPAWPFRTGTTLKAARPASAGIWSLYWAALRFPP